MWQSKSIQSLFNIEHPILQAPMAGSCSPQLVAAVSNAGGLGGYGAASTKPDKLREVIHQIRELTDKPFNINIFAAASENFDPGATPDPMFKALLQKFHDQYDLGELPDPGPLFGPAKEQLQVLLEEKVPVISYHFGLEASDVEQIHTAGSKVICSATTVAEAQHLESLGVDAIIAQGGEAGGHRGTFMGDYQSALIGTIALTPQVVDAVSIPVIAAGGIMDARGIVACAALGASAVQMGTAFLGCEEISIAPIWRQQLKTASATDTLVTEVVSGKPARGLRNRYITEVEDLARPLLPYPLQYSVSRKLRAAATSENDPDFTVMWSGQGVGMYNPLPATKLMHKLVSESRDLVEKLSH